MPADYVVLKNLASLARPMPDQPPRPRLNILNHLTARIGAPFGFSVPAGADSITARATALEPPEPSVEVHSLERHEAADMARDPKTAGLARIMATRLIAPLAAAPGAGKDVWGIPCVQADASSCTGEDVTVAVLDTGIDRNHPAFAGVTLAERDFSGTGSADRDGHGTHCAGTIFGRDVDGTRIGVARGVKKALIGKVLNDDRSGNTDMIFRGIQWALEENAHVISMSLGFDFPGSVRQLTDLNNWPVELATSQVLEAYRENLRLFDSLMQMIKARAAFGQGVVVVAAAGNESKTDVNPIYKIATSLPAAADGIVSVGALQRVNDKLGIAPFSNTSPTIAAPGVDIVSARLGGGLRAQNGTSMACPHVAGVAALWWEQLRREGDPAPSAAKVTARLFNTARTNIFMAGVDAADRGAGLVTAPN